MTNSEQLEKLAAIDASLREAAKGVFELYDALGGGSEAEPEPEPEPTPEWPISAAGVALVKYFESGGDFDHGGNRKYLKAYKDAVGVYTVGYGHTGRTHADGSVYPGREITAAEANELLAQDLRYFAEAVRRLVTTIPLAANQFAALVSFTFNLGEGNLKRSTLLRKLNAKQYEAAAREFEKWVYAGKTKLRGLVRRRRAERLLFEGKDWKKYDV